MNLSTLIPFQPIAAIATTPQAAQTLQPLFQSLGVTLYLPNSLNFRENAQIYQGSLKDHLASIWQENRAFVFCLAAGAVVRLIAPLLKNKASDPAIIVIASFFYLSFASVARLTDDFDRQQVLRQLYN